MPQCLPAISRLFALALACLCLAACERGAANGGTAIGVAARQAPQAAGKPVDAVNVLREAFRCRAPQCGHRCAH